MLRRRVRSTCSTNRLPTARKVRQETLRAGVDVRWLQTGPPWIRLWTLQLHSGELRWEYASCSDAPGHCGADGDQTIDEFDRCGQDSSPTGRSAQDPQAGVGELHGAMSWHGSGMRRLNGPN